MFIKTPFHIIDDAKEREDIKNLVEDHLKPVLYKESKWYEDYVNV